MYESHFGLTGLPFQLTPDPAFVFESKAYLSALAALRRGLADRIGVLVVTGEAGAGKTTLVQALLATLDAASTAAVRLSASGLDRDTLVERLAARSTQSQPLDPLAPDDALLATLAASGRTTLLVIDEAQHLTSSAFAMLESLAKAAAPLPATLPILLLGQPELRILLNAPERIGLRELIGIDRHLGPLEQGEVRLYVEHRLRCAGWTGRPEFADTAFDEIFIFTNGLPRRVNRLCNSLLLTAWLNGEQRIDAPVVTRAAGAILGDSFPAATGLPDAPAGHAPTLSEAIEPAAAASAVSADAPSAPAPAPPAAASEAAPLGERDAAVEPINSRLAGLVHRDQRAARGPRQAVLASVAIVIALTMIAYFFERPTLRTGLTQSELRSIVDAQPAGSGVAAAAPAEEPPTPAATLPPAPLRTAPAPSAVADVASAAAAVPQPPAAAREAESPQTPSCSSAAFALGLCDVESPSPPGSK